MFAFRFLSSVISTVHVTEPRQFLTSALYTVPVQATLHQTFSDQSDVLIYFGTIS